MESLDGRSNLNEQVKQSPQPEQLLMISLGLGAEKETKLTKGKGAWDHAWRRPEANFQECFPGRITQNGFNFLSHQLLQHR